MSSPRQIVFIPGWGFQASIAKNFISASTQLVDLPPVKGSCNTMEALCLTIEEKIQPEGAILLGWSLGGLLTVNLYNRHPNRYKALILMSSTPCFWAQTNWPGISTDHQTMFLNNLNREYRIFSAYYLQLISKPFSFSKHSSDLYPHFIQKDDFNDHKSYHEILFQADLRSEFSKIKIPTLLIQGGKDTIIPTETNQHLVGLNPRLKYCNIPHAGHIPFITHQYKTNKIIRIFLDSLQ